MIVFVWSLVPKKKKVLLCNLCYLPLDFCFFQRENGWGELRAKCADKLLWWFHFNCLWSIAAPFYMFFFFSPSLYFLTLCILCLPFLLPQIWRCSVWLWRLGTWICKSEWGLYMYIVALIMVIIVPYLWGACDL